MILCAVLIVCMAMAPESPRFLYEKGDYERAFNVINVISKINKGTIHEENWKFDRQAEEYERSGK